MSKETIPTRRSFLKSGALLAAPLVPAAAMAGEDLKARVERLENEAAIRELHGEWVRRVNTGAGDAALDPSVRGIAPDHAGEPDAIEVSAGGRSATGKFCCEVQLATAIAPDTTLAQMAHAQGGGFSRRTEQRVVKVDYLKTNSVWTIAKVEFAQA